MQDNSKIFVRCPHCSNRLGVKLNSNTLPKTLTCPLCHQNSPFDAFKVEKTPAPAPARPQGGETDLLVGGRVVAGSQHSAYSPLEAPGYDPNKTEVLSGAMRNDDPTDEKTHFDSLSNSSCGKLVFLNGNIPAAQLREGCNIVGREANSSSANIRLPRTFDRISREHLEINVKRVGGGYKHEIKLYKREVNTTMLNSTTMGGGDVYLLNDGDLIKLPELTIRFEK